MTRPDLYSHAPISRPLYQLVPLFLAVAMPPAHVTVRDLAEALDSARWIGLDRWSVAAADYLIAGVATAICTGLPLYAAAFVAADRHARRVLPDAWLMAFAWRVALRLWAAACPAALVCFPLWALLPVTGVPLVGMASLNLPFAIEVYLVIGLYQVVPAAIAAILVLPRAVRDADRSFARRIGCSFVEPAADSVATMFD